MANKLENIVKLASDTATKITKSVEDWAGFLNTAANLYRYSFPDQLLIHAQQRSNNVKACAEFDVWTKRMKYYVRRGARGIALVDVQNGRPSLRYVFDIADTGRKEDSRNLYLWQYKEEYQDAIIKALEKYFGVVCNENFTMYMGQLATELTKRYWKEYKQDIICGREGSSMEGLDERSFCVKFSNIASYSITYILLKRFGFHPGNYHGVFQDISDFNTPGVTKILGHVVSEASGDVLHQIAIAIFAYEREKKAAQSTDNPEQTGTGTNNKPEKHNQPSSFILTVDNKQEQQPSIKDIYEQYKPIVKKFILNDKAYLNACKNSDKENAFMEGLEAVRRAALSIKDLEFMKLFYDLAEFHNRMQQEVLAETYPELSKVQEPDQEESVADELKNAGAEPRQEESGPAGSERDASEQETIVTEQEQKETVAENPESNTSEPESEQAAVNNPKVEAEPGSEESVHENLESYTKAEQKPDYKVGDIVYLEETPYEITEIGLFDVQLCDPSQAYPIFRVESKSHFEDMLQRDHRNMLQSEPDQNEASPPKQTVILNESEVEVLPPAHPASNYRITDDHLGEGSAKDKYTFNMYAIVMLKKLESDNRAAAPGEQEILAHYVGWGGIPQAFEKGRDGWEREYQELQSLLTPEEYDSVRASVLNSHFTSPVIIKAIYAAVSNMGFKRGNILEPSCGIGNFFGCLPESMSKSKLYGVELDSITGRIAQFLYPSAKISVCGYEKADFPKNFFDLAIGNVPFGQYKVSDSKYNSLKFSVHNYFFAKTLDLVRPGGIIVFITSRYTMDAQNTDVRKYLAERADLLGAIRLPNNAFRANAGTDVVSDIIFIQKREAPAVDEPAWVQTAENSDGFTINSYFLAHPDMVLGIPSSKSTQYGRPNYTVLPIPEADLGEQLREAAMHIHGEYQEAAHADTTEKVKTAKTIPADSDVKNYSFTLVGSDVYYREDSIMTMQSLNATAKSRVTGMIKLRDCVHGLIALQMDENTPDSEITQKQAELNRLYDAFTRKYGLINNKANRLSFDRDSAYYLLCSLEILDDDGNLKRKADMFVKRTIKPHKFVTHVDTASEALIVSIGERAKVDLQFMSDISGKSESELITELRGVIFKDPVNGIWQTADEYLSGNVRRKLCQAKAAESNPDYQINIDALEKAQPKDLDASEIEVRIGATWIDKSYIQQFMIETLNTPFYLRNKIIVNFMPVTGQWAITSKNSIPYNDVAAYTTYGTSRANAYRILEDSLNLRDIRIYDTVLDENDKEKRIINVKETTLAAQKQQALREAFREWIFKDPERRQKLCSEYNRLFNSVRPREYDGSHIRFTGMNQAIHLRTHQINAIGHILYGGNTLLAHSVGAGKTFEVVAAAMESKRLGLCSKSMIVVPNHLTEQWASEFLRLYPSANILVTTKKDFQTANRKKFCARIATSDIDAVIIGHSQFEKIPVSYERQERLIQSQISEITDGIREVKASNGERFAIKQLERTKKELEARLQKLQANYRKDTVVSFEQLGVDRLFVDEAQAYKNLFLYTKMRNVAGLSTASSQKSSDMFAKCQYMDEVTGGRGVIFATGTPISNSITEMYTMMRYLQYDMLKELGMLHFDNWASAFGETTTSFELAPEGTGYRARTRFAKFFNLPELMAIFKESADIQTADMLKLPVPEVEFRNVVCQPTEHQKAMVEELSKRAEKVHRGIDSRIDNMLKITSDGRKIGLDQRIINPMLPDDPDSKVNACVGNVYRIWEEYADIKASQLIFSDISTPNNDGSFNVYDDIRQKLVQCGIPAEQIAFIHSAKSEVQKKELFAKVRSGQVRVLIGSTQKMGTGTNVQERLISLHDLDVPWRPADLEQRSGRLIRQGNQNEKVFIFRYITTGTFDRYLWQTIESKQKFISQIMTSKSPVRSCEDVDEAALSYAEIKALCAGDVRIKERMQLELEVSKLRIMQSDFKSKKYKLEDSLMKQFPEQIAEAQSYVTGIQSDIQTLNKNLRSDGSFAGMVIRGNTYTEKEAAGNALIDICQEISSSDPVEIGSYLGFKMSVKFSEYVHKVIVKGAVAYHVELGNDVFGNITRINNALGKLEEQLQYNQTKLENLLQQQEAAKAEVDKPFPQEEELRVKSARLAELDAALNIGTPDPNTAA